MTCQVWPRAGAASKWRRWTTFNMVGLLGFLLQIGVLWILIDWATLGRLASTALAVEIAVLHNFFWHERWTWANRSLPGGGRRWGRLLRFHWANGAVCMAGNLLFTPILAQALAVHYVVANALAVGCCAILTFTLCSRWVFSAAEPGPPSPWILLALIAVLSGSELRAARLSTETVSAWRSYIEATERRIDQELDSDRGFLALDFTPRGQTERQRLIQSREILVARVTALTETSSPLEVPDGLIHHWRATVFIKGTTLRQILSVVENPGSIPKQEDVLASEVLERGPDWLRLYLRVQRSKIVTVVYSTEHLVKYRTLGAGKAVSRSVATRIRELENANTPRERPKAEGRGYGFLWRWNSYWRYEEVAGGVLVECESISLSRSIPFLLEPFIRSQVEDVARESMQRTLAHLRDQMAGTALPGTGFWTPPPPKAVTDQLPVPY